MRYHERSASAHFLCEYGSFDVYHIPSGEHIRATIVFRYGNGEEDYVAFPWSVTQSIQEMAFEAYRLI